MTWPRGRARRGHGEALHVVVGRHEVDTAHHAVVDLDPVAVAADDSGRDDLAVGGRPDRRAAVGGEVTAGVQPPVVQDRVEPHAELGGDPAVGRPREEAGARSSARRRHPAAGGPQRGRAPRRGGALAALARATSDGLELGLHLLGGGELLLLGDLLGGQGLGLGDLLRGERLELLLRGSGAGPGRLARGRGLPRRPSWRRPPRPAGRRGAPPGRWRRPRPWPAWSATGSGRSITVSFMAMRLAKSSGRRGAQRDGELAHPLVLVELGGEPAPRASGVARGPVPGGGQLVDGAGLVGLATSSCTAISSL